MHALDFAKFRNDKDWHYVILEPHDGFVSKTQLRASGASALAPIKIPALAPTLAPDMQEDRTLCPVRALKYYLSRTRDFRKGSSLLFVSFSPSHGKDICRNTVSGWVRNLLTKVHQDTPQDLLRLSNTRAHELRAVASSLAFRGNVDFEEIMQACSWRSSSTFSSFTLRDVSRIQGQLNVLGPLVAAQTVVHPPSNKP